MEERSNILTLNYTNEAINSLLANLKGEGVFSRHFTQTEDFFLRFQKEFRIAQFPIYHNIKNQTPADEYLEKLYAFLAEVAPLAPQVFRGLTYFFDPEEIFKPCFFKLYKLEGRSFLFLVRIDLGFRPNYQTIIKWGNNDLTHSYQSPCLFLEPLCLPLERIEAQGGKLKAFRLHTLFSETWIGEYGRGYFVQGIWMDNDLTKFFTKLLLKPGISIYPYYPFSCKYRTISAMPIWFTDKERNILISTQHKLIKLLEPYLPAIQQELKEKNFSEQLTIFQEIKSKLNCSLPDYWSKIRPKAYINSTGQKEFMFEESAPTL